MNVYHLPVCKVDDTFIGIEKPHAYPTWPNSFHKSLEQAKTTMQVVKPAARAVQKAFEKSKSADYILKMNEQLNKPKTEEMVVQTQAPPQIMKQFQDMKANREWSNSVVDPFLKVVCEYLRFSIITCLNSCRIFENQY